MTATIRRAHWHPHVNRIGAPAALRHWLTGRGSLTAKLIAHADAFRVERLRQHRALCLADEYAMIGLPGRRLVHEREVLLRCDGRAAVFAHTVIPLGAGASDWPFFRTLGERSLGHTLFSDPQVRRGALHYARLHPAHPLAMRARQAAGREGGPADAPLYARRSLFMRGRGAMLVTEVFLPPVTTLQPRDRRK
ncbi:MAG: chorismate--pyruvate lyase family protein [Burkholderiaceae bacterium]